MSTQSSRNGNTAVRLSTQFANALQTLNVQARGFGSTRINNGVAHFAITGGAVDLTNTRVEIIHSGGLTLRRGNTEVNLTDFVITNIGNRATLTGAVVVNGELITRAPLFNVQVRNVGTSTLQGRSNLDIRAGIRLSGTAANALNQAFGTTAFTAGINIGTADVDAFFNPGNGNISERRLPLRDFPQNNTQFPGATQDVVARGSTTVDFDDSLVNALGVLNVEVRSFGNARFDNGIADFLITGGVTDLDTTSVEIQHSGGLTFSGGNTEVRLTDFTISNLAGRAVLSGAVIADDTLVGRLPLFNLRVRQVTTEDQGRLTNVDLRNVGVKLTGRAATALNQAFDVNAFTAGLTIGTAQVDAFVV